MRVIIYGAGGVGCVVGGYLARTGQEVILIGRPSHMQAINKDGLRLVTPTGTHTLRLQAVTAPQEVKFRPDDVVFLCVKAQSTEEAIRDLRAVVQDIPIFCIQNGVSNEEIVAQYFPRVYGVMVINIGAIYINDGEVISRYDPPGFMVIGRYPQGTDRLVERVVEELRAAEFHVLSTSDVMPYKWGKMIRNLTNTTSAICNTSRRDLSGIADAVQKELTMLLVEAGIRWVTDQELASDLPDFALPPRGEVDVKSEVRGSTWQSLARQTGNVETEAFNGEVVRLAKKLGRQAPINEKLLEICLDMAAKKELPGKYTPAELSRLLGIS